MNPLVHYLKQRGAHGRERAVRREDLSEWTGMDVRTVKMWSEDNRLSGTVPVVCYGQGGIYLTDDPEEIESMRAKILRECRRRLRQLRGLRAAKRHAMGSRQLEMF